MKKIFLIISILILQTNLSAQKSYVSVNDLAVIKQQLNVHFGVDYEIDDAIFVDSLENHYDRNRHGIYDEYGTLDNCIVFTASEYERYKSINRVIGVYRTNQIIWYSENIADEYILGAGFIDMIEDINNDGKVEIMTIWETEGGAAYRYRTLYVHSWDGTQGNIAVDMSYGSSPIGCSEFESFYYIDVNGDGKWEIISFPNVFEWDGSKYLLSETMQLDSIAMFFPRNNFIPIVNASIVQIEDKFIYSFSVENSNSSAQSINEFDVYGFDDYVKVYGSIEVESTDVTTLAQNWRGVRLGTSISWEGYPIKPGESLSGFSYSTDGLPIIDKAYLRAYNYQWAGDYQENTSVKDYLNNSVIIKTVAAKLPPSPFNQQEFLDSLINYNIHSYQLNWIINQATSNKYDSLFNAAKVQLQQNNNNAVRITLQTVLQEVDIDSTENLTSEAYALLRYNTEYLLEQIPQSSPNLLVNLKNSLGNQIPASNVMYYEGSWKDAVNNGDGTFTVITTTPTVSIRMFYEYANQTVNNVPAQNNTYTFTTVNAAVQLKNSSGNLIDEGTVQYYAGAWRSFGTTINGVAYKELLPVNYSFRMTYEYVLNDKQQNLSENPVVDFSTVLCTIKVTNANNQPLEGANTKYYSIAWRDIGLTNSSGEITKELLPKNLSFRATYNNVSQDKQQDISVNNLVEIMLNVP